MVNEAMLELIHRTPGPVQINVPMHDPGLTKFIDTQLPDVRAMKRYMSWDNWTISHSHYVDVEEWLSQLCNSSCIITNSFHTVIFAIIFRKPFILIPRNIGLSTDEIDYEQVYQKLELIREFLLNFLKQAL
jgi:exopolysaccharide biosynthesis predicted pyruvyltransferase EpsI